MSVGIHYNIVIIGAGNVAWHLAPALADAGHHIMQVFSRNIENAQFLAKQVGAEAVNTYDNIDSTAHIYIYALKDDALQWVANQVKIRNGLHLHTSGSVPMNIFDKIRDNYGCLYPLQTFSKEKSIDLRKVPFFIEANSADNLTVIRGFVYAISRKIYELSSADRRLLHLAGVLACNFTNMMYIKAEEILATKQIPFSVMHGLITEGVNKTKQIGPLKAQTGPAARQDYRIIEQHKKLLNKDSPWEKIYELLTDEIVSRTK